MDTTAEGGASALLKEFYTFDQLCHELGIASRTLKRWTQIGVAPPSVKIGVHRLFRHASVCEWLLSRETPSGSTRRARRKFRPSKD